MKPSERIVEAVKARLPEQLQALRDKSAADWRKEAWDSWLASAQGMNAIASLQVATALQEIGSELDALSEAKQPPSPPGVPDNEDDARALGLAIAKKWPHAMPRKVIMPAAETNPRLSWLATNMHRVEISTNPQRMAGRTVAEEIAILREMGDGDPDVPQHIVDEAIKRNEWHIAYVYADTNVGHYFFGHHTLSALIDEAFNQMRELRGKCAQCGASPCLGDLCADCAECDE